MASIDARHDATLWSPGLRLVQRRGSRTKALLLLLLFWLALLLLSMLALKWMKGAAPAGLLIEGLKLEPLRGMVGAAWPLLYWATPGVLGVALLAVLYLAACTWMSMDDRPGARWPRSEAGGGPVPGGLHSHDDQRRAPMSARPDDLAALRRSTQELAVIHLALQLSNQQVGAAIAEAGRRTLTSCGAFDSCTKHVDVAGADLDAVQDEALHTQQVMSALRAQLLKLSGHCHALGSVARRPSDSAVLADETKHIDEQLAVMGTEIGHCHQLTERIGGAERSSERRIDSIRRCIEGLGHHVERGLREGQQVMALTRQIETSLAEGARQLQQLAGVCGAAEAADSSPPSQAPQEAPRGT